MRTVENDTKAFIGCRRHLFGIHLAREKVRSTSSTSMYGTIPLSSRAYVPSNTSMSSHHYEACWFLPNDWIAKNDVNRQWKRERQKPRKYLCMSNWPCAKTVCRLLWTDQKFQIAHSSHAYIFTHIISLIILKINHHYRSFKGWDHRVAFLH